jgi:hypothetical protein
MDDEWEDVHGEPSDLDGSWCDVTGNPALDVDGYQSPRRTGNLTGFTSSQIDWLAQAKADRAKREARREADRQQDRLAEKLAAQLKAVEQNKAETRERVAQRRQSPPGPTVKAQRVSSSRETTPATSPPAPGKPVQATRDEIVRRSLTELQPGQHGAYFERRIVRPWYAPWKKVVRWQQVGAWQNTTPPRSGTEVVSVGSLDELEGKVRTIGKVSPSGAVEY